MDVMTLLITGFVVFCGAAAVSAALFDWSEFRHATQVRIAGEVLGYQTTRAVYITLGILSIVIAVLAAML